MLKDGEIMLKKVKWKLLVISFCIIYLGSRLCYYSFPDYIYCPNINYAESIGLSFDLNSTYEDVFRQLYPESTISYSDSGREFINTVDYQIYFAPISYNSSINSDLYINRISIKTNKITFGKKNIGIGSSRAEIENIYKYNYFNDESIYKDGDYYIFIRYDKNNMVSQFDILFRYDAGQDIVL